MAWPGFGSQESPPGSSEEQLTTESRRARRGEGPINPRPREQTTPVGAGLSGLARRVPERKQRQHDRRQEEIRGLTVTLIVVAGLIAVLWFIVLR